MVKDFSYWLFYFGADLYKNLIKLVVNPKTDFIFLKAGVAEQLTLMSTELESHRKLVQKVTTEKERMEDRLNYLEKSLEDKSNECVFLSEESQVRF